MSFKDLNKNKLRDKTCDTCHHKIRTLCVYHYGYQGEAVLLPEENTCRYWKKREIPNSLNITQAKTAEIDLNDFWAAEEIIEKASLNEK